MSTMTGLLEGKVALITGAARGQGRSHALKMAEQGASILALDVCRRVSTAVYDPATPEDLAETHSLVEKAGGKIVTGEIDVRDLGALTEFVRSGAAELGGLDIVVANAGVNVWGGLLDAGDEDPWDDTIGINLTGVYNTLRAAAPLMIKNGQGGSIIITSSATGLKALPGMIAYAASKYGVTGLMKAAAIELGQHEIRVNSVHPWAVNTPMGGMHPFGESILGANPSFVDSFKQVLHDPPLAEASDISDAVLFLASPLARTITGVALPVDQGNTIV
ncbi:mycofactocin-coupled SDR family oxidoreductase [Aeromicrobium sp. UC242_57]|uniref:mycofactocin-coupled SDR family oxidoreductase n=1 Tax=Aeromicrobium sp. UC242_57 TaxID=3374624 RepID=UPI0037A4F399